MSRTILDIHILQTVPPSNLNRDDTGSPKTAVYGGAQRARVSSQAWKRATRTAFRDLLDATDLGVRTKRLVELVAEQITGLDEKLAGRAAELAAETLKAAGISTKPPKGKKDAPPESEYLVFLSERQIQALARAAVTAADSGDVKASLKEQKVKNLADREHSIDVALFGRMVAEATDLNVDASAQVAHALSVHSVVTEYDYFTAVDDRSGDAEQGASMIGTVEFNSATLYRYANIDVDRLHDNLGDATATRRAVEAFVRAFTTSMPTGKQNTFANRTLPDAVVVKLRQTQPISFVAAFEEPVGAPHIARAADVLAAHALSVETAFDEKALRTWVVRVGDATKPLAELCEEDAEVGMADLVEAVGSAVGDRIGDER